MSFTALGLVLVAAFLHGSWNLLAKHAAHCRHFNWFYPVSSYLRFTPAAVYFFHRISAFDVTLAGVLLASGTLHIAYSGFICNGAIGQRIGRSATRWHAAPARCCGLAARC